MRGSDKSWGLFDLISMKWEEYKQKLRRKQAGIVMAMRTKCQHCGAEIETTFGADPPGYHQEATGTSDDPRAPGDFDNICEVCNYRDHERGGILGPRDLAEEQQAAPGEWQPEGW